MRNHLFVVGVGLVLGAAVGCGSNAGPSSGEPGIPLPGLTNGGSGPPGGGAAADAPIDPSDPDASEDRRSAVVEALAIAEIAVFQAVKVSVAKGVTPVAKRTTPIIAGRDALVRVYVKPFEDWTAHPTVAELRIENSGAKVPLILDTKTITKASIDDDLATTFNFDVPGEHITPDTEFSVVIRETTGKGKAEVAGGARFPEDGSLSRLEAKKGATVVKIKIVPVKYDADGSGRLPDVSAAAIERYRAAAYAMYPTAKVEISVREPMSWTQAIAGNGGGWSSVLNGVLSVRAQDRAPKDVYYYGAFVPKAQLREFCRQGCVLGLSGLVDDPRDYQQRASVGLGYSGQESTMVHEVGHAQGRAHVNCGGAQGIDPDYPYQDGSIGVWGYDLVTKKLHSPSKAKDFMGYCEPAFTSDYTFNALFERISFVNSNAAMTGISREPKTYRYLNVGAEGVATWGDTVRLEQELYSQPHSMRFTADDGRALDVTGHFYPYGDLPGGYFLVPEPPKDFSNLTLLDRPRNVAVPSVIRLAR